MVLSVMRDLKNEYNERNNTNLNTIQYTIQQIRSERNELYVLASPRQVKKQAYFDAHTGCSVKVLAGPHSGESLIIESYVVTVPHYIKMQGIDKQILSTRISILLDEQGRALRVAEIEFRGVENGLRRKYHTAGAVPDHVQYRESQNLKSTAVVTSSSVWKTLSRDVPFRQSETPKLLLGTFPGLDEDGADLIVDAANQFVLNRGQFLGRGLYPFVGDYMRHHNNTRPSFSDLRQHLSGLGVSGNTIAICLLTTASIVELIFVIIKF